MTISTGDYLGSKNITFTVRHPIERLLSAYRDRIAGLKASYKQYMAMAKTLHLRRKDAVIEVKYTTKRKVKGKGSVVKEIKNKRDVSVPTWPEFVNYILLTGYSKDVSLETVLIVHQLLRSM